MATYGLSNCNRHWIPQQIGRGFEDLVDPDSDSNSANARDEEGQRKCQSIFGSLMWLMLATRAFTAPNAQQVQAARPRNTAPIPSIGYTDSDFAGDPDDRKSTSVCIHAWRRCHVLSSEAGICRILRGSSGFRGSSRQDAPTDEIWIFREDALFLLCP